MLTVVVKKKDDISDLEEAGLVAPSPEFYEGKKVRVKSIPYSWMDSYAVGDTGVITKKHGMVHRGEGYQDLYRVELDQPHKTKFVFLIREEMEILG